MIAAFALVMLSTPPVTALAVSPDGKSVVVGSQAGIEIRGSEARKLSTELANVHDLAFSPDGKQLAACGGTPGERGSVELFDWPIGQRAWQAQPHKDLVYAVAWSSDGATLATAGADKLVRTLDAKAGNTLQTCDGHSQPVLAVAFLPGDKELVSAGVDESIRVWNAANGEPVRSMTNHTRAVLGLAVRPGGDELVSIGADRTVRVWQPGVGRLVRFARLSSEPRAVAFSREGKAIFVACADGRVRALDFESLEKWFESPAITGVAHSIAIAPDGLIHVGGHDGQAVTVSPQRP